MDISGGGWRSRIVGHGEASPGELTANPRNWRKHPKAQRDALAAVLDRVGWVQDVIVNRTTGHLVDGHARLDLARQRGEASVPVVYVELDADEEALVLATLDPLSAMAETDDAALRALIDGVTLDDPLRAMLDAVVKPEPVDGLTDPDDVPEPVEDSYVQRGEIYVLGGHRLMCGDSTDAGDVARLLDGAKVEMLFTSPPYLQQREYGEASVLGDWDALMEGVFGAYEPAPDCQVLVNLGLIHRDGAVVRYWEPWIRWMESRGERLFGWYVWDKISATFKANDGRPYIAHEWVFHFNRVSKPVIEWVETKHGGEMRSVWGQRKPDGHVARLSTPGRIKDHKPPDSIARVQRETSNADESVRSHPARFPVEFAEYWVGSWAGDVYEPFAGSGTTIIAAERTGRRCYAMEIEPRYVQVAITRWEQFTGRKAEKVQDAT